MSNIQGPRWPLTCNVSVVVIVSTTTAVGGQEFGKHMLQTLTRDGVEHLTMNVIVMLVILILGMQRQCLHQDQKEPQNQSKVFHRGGVSFIDR